MSAKPIKAKTRNLFFLALILLCCLVYGAYASGGFGMADAGSSNNPFLVPSSPGVSPTPVPMVTVPGMYGMEQEEAAMLLSRIGLDVGFRANEQLTESPPYYVIGQSIAGGSEVPSATEVQLKLGYRRDVKHTLSAMGLLSEVKVTFSVNNDLCIASISVDCSGEHKELAAPCAEEAFLSQFIGQKGPFYNIDVVTNATQTSNAIAEALNQFYAYAN